MITNNIIFILFIIFQMTNFIFLLFFFHVFVQDFARHYLCKSVKYEADTTDELLEGGTLASQTPPHKHFQHSNVEQQQ